MTHSGEEDVPNDLAGGYSGGDSGALRDKGEKEQERYADEYYESIRNRKSKSDINTIAQHNNLSIEQVTKIREHIFVKEHDLGEGEKGRFDTDYRMAQAWQRLEQGNGTELDKLLLQHEQYELELMSKYGYNYPEAHREAQKKYPWSDRVEEEGK